ncbi:MAG TPA: hypothetical protein VED83_00355, partial [Burkholderiaceae bacterium]|nr:hypothetical protein [Burkholderiaceae bacterium]
MPNQATALAWLIGTKLNCLFVADPSLRQPEGRGSSHLRKQSAIASKARMQRLLPASLAFVWMFVRLGARVLERDLGCAGAPLGETGQDVRRKRATASFACRNRSKLGLSPPQHGRAPAGAGKHDEKTLNVFTITFILFIKHLNNIPTVVYKQCLS